MMINATWRVCGVAVITVLTLSGGTRAEDAKPIDAGKGSEFKGKKLDIKDGGQAAVLLSFAAGEKFEATTDGVKDTDVSLFVYDEAGKQVGKDDSPGPKCSVKYTPKEEGRFKFVIKNAKGANTVTFEVKVTK